MSGIARRSWHFGLVCLIAAGCLPRDRLNSTCDWTDDSAGALDLRRDADRKHLELDAAIAEEIGVRYGDSFRGAVSLDETGRKTEQCTNAALARIVKLHGVALSKVQAARGVRKRWLDVFTIFVPLVLLFALAADLITRRIDRGFDPEERVPKILSLAALAPVSGILALMLGQIWEIQVDVFRLRNPHLSYRTFRLPIQAHHLQAWTFAVVLFIAVASLRYRALRRAPIHPIERRSQADGLRFRVTD